MMRSFSECGDVEACAARIREVLALDAAGRHKVAEVGRARAGRYSWDSSARRIGAMLRELETA